MLGTITLTVGQTDGVSVSQKEEAPGTMDTIQDEVAPQVNGEKEEKESPDANEISVVEEKAAEEKPDETNEVGFKKIFRFVGFKFTLKKDKSEEKDPVKLLNVKEKEEEEDSKPDATEDATVKVEENGAETSTTKSDVTEAIEEPPASEISAEDAAAEAVEGEEAPKEEEAESSPPAQEVTQSPFKKFAAGLFSNLRKKASIKKSKEEEEETAAEEETKEAEETAEAVGEEGEKAAVEEEAKEAQPTTTPEEVKPELSPESEASAAEESKEEVTVETPAPAADSTDEPAPVVEKAEEVIEGEKAPAEVTNEAELLSSQEKVKAHGSPLKKLFTGAGLKKLSTKKHKKDKKEAEAKLTESGEQAAEQLQSSSDSAEGQKPDSGASSPEESGEHVIGVEAGQAEPAQEAEGEVTSDGEKKKEGIIPWSSFKKLVTPKKRVKRSSESEDEATGEKPVKSATLSSTESAVFADKCSEEEAKEDKPTEEEPKTENAEKLESSTEEPKKKMDTSVSWEALMCMGGAKKRTRRTSDSDDEETKMEEEAAPAVEAGEEQEATAVESPTVTSQDADAEVQAVSSPEPAAASPPERESAWDTLKRLVTRSKSKVEEKTEESTEQVVSDSEVPKEESSFSLRKLFPGRRKKKVEKQLSAELASGEEDSDTPAVVPLSEYDVETKEEAAVEVPQITVEEPAVTQTKISVEDRSPSWIPAISVAEDDDEKQLSDIPEEAENAATPKSADTTIADDVEDQCGGRRLSKAEVMPVVVAPPGETSPVPQGPSSETVDMVLETAVVQVNEIPCQTSVTVEDVQLEVASAKTEFEPPIEQAESEVKAVLESHVQDDAMAICTGLGTAEIADVDVEEPVMATVECVSVCEALSMEVLVEEKTSPTEDAIASEDTLIQAQVEQVETTELEPALGDIVSEVLPELQTASEGQEPEIEKVTTVNAVHEESEIVQPSESGENSPKIVLVDPIASTVEAAVLTESVEVTEAGVEIKAKEMELEQFAATEEIAPVEEMVQVISQEMTSTLSDTTQNTSTEGVEPSISVVTADEEVAEEILSAALPAELEQVETEEVVAISESDGEPTEVQETNMVDEGAAESEVSVVLEQVNEKVEDEIMVENANAIEEQGMVIAKAVIQNAMDKVSESKAEEIETESEEMPEAEPKSPKILHAAVEVVCSGEIESLDALTEEEPVEEIKQAVEETISEEIVMEEVEAVEINTESEEEVKPEEEKEVKPEEEKEVAHVSEEVEAEAAPVEEVKEPMPELHVPTQVVLQVAHVVEGPSLEEESVVEFDSNGPLDDLSTVSTEEDTPSKDTVAETEKAAAGKCAEVMAQVIEVIEEAVKEIEPVSTDIAATS